MTRTTFHFPDRENRHEVAFVVSGDRVDAVTVRKAGQRWRIAYRHSTNGRDGELLKKCFDEAQKRDPEKYAEMMNLLLTASMS